MTRVVDIFLKPLDYSERDIIEAEFDPATLSAIDALDVMRETVRPNALYFLA